MAGAGLCEEEVVDFVVREATPRMRERMAVVAKRLIYSRIYLYYFLSQILLNLIQILLLFRPWASGGVHMDLNTASNVEQILFLGLEIVVSVLLIAIFYSIMVLPTGVGVLVHRRLPHVPRHLVGTLSMPCWHLVGTLLVPCWYLVGTLLVPCWHLVGTARQYPPPLAWVGANNLATTFQVSRK